MRKIRLFGSRKGATAVIVLLRPLLYRLKDVGPHSRTDFSPYLPVKGYINPVTAVLNQIERAIWTTRFRRTTIWYCQVPRYGLAEY